MFFKHCLLPVLFICKVFHFFNISQDVEGKKQFFGKRGMDPWTMKEALETQAERKAAKDYANTELREIT